MIGGVSAIALTSTSIAYENTSCDGDQHLAAWMVQLKGAKGSTLSFPIFVDATSGASTSFGPYVLVACFRPADIAANDPNRSAAGSVVDSFSLALSPFFRPTVDGDYRWRSVWTPFTAGTGTLNTAGAVEAQSIVTIPTGQVVIFGKKSSGLRSWEEDRARHDHGAGPRRRRAGWPRPRHDPSRVNLRQAQLARWGEGRYRRWLHDVRHVARAEGVLPGEQLARRERPWSIRLPGVVYQRALHRCDLRWRTHDQRHDAGQALASRGVIHEPAAARPAVGSWTIRAAQRLTPMAPAHRPV